MKRDGARVAFSDSVLQAARTGEQQQSGKAARQTDVRSSNTTAFQAVPTTRHRKSRVDPVD
jgi:hypothetical protein